MKTPTSNIFCSFLLALSLLITSTGAFAQDELGSDDLFKLARTEAFDKSNYPKAIALSKKALQRSPDYAEIRVFLGRVYTWSDKLDSARAEFNTVLLKEPTNEDALSASFDLEYRNDNYETALKIVDRILRHNPTSEEFAIKKARTLGKLGRTKEGLLVTDNFLIKYPNSKPAADVRESLQDSLRINRLGLGYSFIYFDKRFSDPWQTASLSYGINTKKLSFSLGLNYANRFRANATELEGETYPRIMKGLYAYVGGAAALTGDGLYPKYRIGFSLYKSLPKSFEAELGIRHLQFSSTTDVFVVGLGKYVGNNFYNVRSYFTPSDGTLSASVNLIVKFLLSDDRNDYFGFNLGSGASPDDRSRILDVPNLLNSYKLGLDYSRTIRKKTIIGLSGTYINEEYFTDTRGKQFNASISIQRKF